MLLSPGLLLEAPTYALEFGLQVPVSQELDHAPELRLGLLIGIRLIY